uniref:Uncharacterized protein n=1 Tax=Arundo donax TaxID=35708 RepID=A0A0A9BEA2_ARUDO
MAGRADRGRKAWIVA